MILRRSEIATLEQTRTIVAAMPIERAWNIEVEVASVGHVPRTRIRTGFSAIIPRRKIANFLLFDIIHFLLRL